MLFITDVARKLFPDNGTGVWERTFTEFCPDKLTGYSKASMSSFARRSFSTAAPLTWNSFPPAC